MYQQVNFHVLTGGPGSGKSALIAALRGEGHTVVEESAREIIQAQLAIGGNAVHWGNRRLFAELMLSHAIADYMRLAEAAGPVFFDRGVTDLLGYCRLTGMAVPAHFRRAAEIYRVNASIFVAPPWEAIYRNDVERKQDFAEAVATYEAVVAGYREAGYDLVELPRASVSERVAFVLDGIGG